MDDLLALMEGTNEEDARQPSSAMASSTAPQEPLDELLTLMDGTDTDGSNNMTTATSSTTTDPSRTRKTQRTALVTPTHHQASSSSSWNTKRPPKRNRSDEEDGASLPSTTTNTNTKPMEAGIDDRLGIRMLNRNVSSVDLLDLVTTNPYHSPANLSAMSLARRCQLLIDPPRVVDSATVCGKTNLVTVGIVFSNTGTRISSKGGAFCVLTIGNFASGPCVSVLLFGDVYSRNCASCGPGKVVALVNPKLIPPREDGAFAGGATTVSFTVHDNRQFMLVAKAQDYGTCQATVSVKQPDGKWTASGKCKNYIDRRRCQQYCDAHRNHQLKKAQTSSFSKNNTTKQKDGMTYIQHLRSEFGPTPKITKSMSNTAVSVKPNNGNNFLVVNHPSNAFPSNPYMKQQSSATVSFGSAPHGVPMHMTKQLQQTPNMNRGMEKRKSDKAMEAIQKRMGDRHQSKKNSSESVAPQVATKSGRSTLRGIVGTKTSKDWLQTGTNKRRMPLSTLPSKRAKSTKQSINTSGGGFDGAVPVPKPSALFRSRVTKVVARATTAFSVEEDPAAVAASIRQQQLDLAKRMKEQQQQQCRPVSSSSSSSSATKIGRNATNTFANLSVKVLSTGRGAAAACAAAKKSSKLSTNSGGTSSFTSSFFGDMGKEDLEKVRNTKSRFANEADAEDYAKSRQAILELEKLESSKMNSDRNKKKKDQNGKLGKEWICMTCGGKKYMLQPTSCIAASHKVKLQRVLTKEATKADKRTQLQEKSIEDGGLRLGAGLDWSRPPTWSRFS